MIRLIARLILNLLATALGLLAAAAILDDFSVDAASFVMAVVIFSLSTTILGPLVAKIALQSAPYLIGGIALVTTFVGLVLTNLLSEGLTINGVSTWVLATLIIWIFSIIANLLLPLIIFKKALSKDKNDPAASA